MSYYDSQENAEAYIEMAAEYDGRELIDLLKTHLRPGATVLELGMGPGKDLVILSETYDATGSDNAQTFLDLYKKKDATADLIKLDAVTLDVDRRFDCIYSNKVLHHLTREELRRSFRRQAKILNPNGILFHAFWSGDREEEIHGMRFVYYTEQTVQKLIGNEFEVITSKRYEEMEEDDSFYLILRKTL